MYQFIKNSIGNDCQAKIFITNVDLLLFTEDYMKTQNHNQIHTCIVMVLILFIYLYYVSVSVPEMRIWSI